MKRADVLDRLRAVEPKLKGRGVAALYLFGSYARDDAEDRSDLDLFVDPIDGDAFDLAHLIDTLALLEQAFPGIEIGYSTREGIVPCYLPHIEHGAVRVF